MRKWDFVLIILLVISLGFNYFIWRDVRDIREKQVGIASRDQVDDLEADISEAIHILEVFTKEQRWLKESTFLLDKQTSGTDLIPVTGLFTFNRMELGQSPYLLYREKGTQNWLHLELKETTVLTYAGKLHLSPVLEYEYQLAARGDEIKASEISLIPYNVYGLPKWKEEIKPVPGDSNKMEFNIYVYISQHRPLPDMEPKNVSLILTADGKELEILPFSPEKTDNTNTWSVRLTFSDPTIVDKIEAFVEVEYMNGLKRKDDIELFQQRVQYEMSKHAEKIPG